MLLIISHSNHPGGRDMLKINVRARDMFDGDIGAVFDNNYE